MLKIVSRKKNYLTPAIIVTLAAVIFSLSVNRVDVQRLDNGFELGYATINRLFFDITGFNELLYEITQLLGYCAFAVAGGFAMLGAYQLFTRRALLKVDPCILVTGVYFALVIVLYFGFDKLCINLRPVAIDGEWEASYPSSHTMLACCVFAALFLRADDYFKKGMAVIMKIVSLVSSVFMAVARLLSGVHWLTDIIGGVIISLAMILWYMHFVQHFGRRYQPKDAD